MKEINRLVVRMIEDVERFVNNVKEISETVEGIIEDVERIKKRVG